MVSINSKTQTFTNGTPNDAGPIDSEFVSLFNNDATLASAITAIENGSISNATTLTLNSNYTGGSPGNMSIMVERGSLPNTGLRWNESAQRWEVSNDGSTYMPFSIPSGILVPFAGSTAPSGYLMCYGQAVSRSAYPDLYAAIGSNWGAGDGSSTFNVPDLRGRIPAGLDNIGGTAAGRITSASTGGGNATTLGGSGGSETHSLTADQNGPHNHGLMRSLAAIDRSGGGGFCAANANVTMDNSGLGTPHNNMQPTVFLNYIIKT